ncbi:MAG: hypothetical protein KGJ57_16630 [Sphingomonadales bacterium]|nr:hypothetical protein [Sphingomonadales bacterium]MDE2171025.1 hypothetical protein [Sphingomonadales bacterium]
MIDKAGSERGAPGAQTIAIGRCRDCLFDMVAGDLATVRADVAVAALCAQRADPAFLGTGIEALDGVLQGALARLRADGIFSGAWGETLCLSPLPAPAKVGGVIMLGMGPTGRNTTGKIRRALRIAASQAARMGASHATFAPPLPDMRLPRPTDVATARAMLLGVADGLERIGCGLKRWSFVAPASQMDALARQFAMAMRRIVEHEDGATIKAGTTRKGIWQTPG